MLYLHGVGFKLGEEVRRKLAGGSMEWHGMLLKGQPLSRQIK